MTKFLTNRWSHFLILLCVLFGFVFFVASDQPIRQRIQFLIFDDYLKSHPRETTGDVVVVDIDDKSLALFGQWPWSRTVMADIVRTLDDMGARVIAFDGVLAEPDRTSPSKILEYLPGNIVEELKKQGDLNLGDNDVVLAQAIKEAGNFVGAFSHGHNKEAPRIVSDILSQPPAVKKYFLNHSRNFDGIAKFLPVLEDVLAGNGSFMAQDEVDSIIRRTSMVLSDRERLYPSLTAEVVRVSHGDRTPVMKLGLNKAFSEDKADTQYRFIIGNYEVPVDSRGMIWLHFRQWDRERDYIPVHELLDRMAFEKFKTRLEGKIVLIASSAEGLLDLRPTPLGLYPGVEIHANAIEQILDNDFLLRPRIVKDSENNFILVVGLLTIFLAPFIGVSWLAVLYGGLTCLVFYISRAAFLDWGLLIDPIYPSIAALSIFMLSSILTYIRTESERKQVREAFGLYISPDFMEELAKDPDKLRLGGETRELTVMFSDIRSFTSISETMSPEALIQLMNDFLTPMSDLVMGNRGTIDKYMGDAMMAFWNAPLDDEDHARHACVAALKMNEELQPINAELLLRAQEEGRKPVLLQAGIGLNTGPASVGNMGSKQRFAYSALGDTVNLASRLEGQTKTYGVDILIGLETQKQVSDFATLELDLLRVKGKAEPVRVFTLLGDEAYAADSSFKALRDMHNKMIASYRSADFKAAERQLAECLRLSDERLAAFYSLYQQRLKDMHKTPPADDWDGVYVATSK